MKDTAKQFQGSKKASRRKGFEMREEKRKPRKALDEALREANPDTLKKLTPK